MHIIDLTGFAASLDGTQIVFDDESMLKSNMSSTHMTLSGGNSTTPCDQLIAGSGGDTLYGLNGNDLLIGGAGNDVLYGGAGNDTLIGGAGNDFLSGGNGSNLFVYFAHLGNGNGSDTVTGFQNGIDTLVINESGSPVAGPVVNAVAFADQTAADLYYTAVQSGADTVISLFDGTAGHTTPEGTVRLINFLKTNLEYTDFKHI